MYNSLEDARTDVHGEACARIEERVTAEVSKMTLSDVWFEISELTSNKNLYYKVCGLIEETYRKHEVNSTIDNLLEELFCKKGNELVFIECLGLEQTIRQILIETMIDREVSDL